MKYKYLKLVAFPFIALIFLSAIPLTISQLDTSAISLNGENWTLKVDSQLQIATDSKSTPYVSTTEKGEKELFLQLNSLEDCKLGYIQFKVQTTGLTVYKQLPLNEEIQLKEGQYDFVNSTHAMLKDTVKVYRPENVVNSFACFDDTGKKVLHIYASKLIDANGQSVWVDSDLKDGLLTVYLDVKFLDSAKFPITLDPTFGYTSIGASEAQTYPQHAYKIKANLTEKGTITDIQLYVNESTSLSFQVGLYNSTNNRLIYGDFTSNSVGWISCDIDDTLLEAGTYWLAFKGSNINIKLRYDGNPTADAWAHENVGATNPLPTIYTESSQYFIYSIYANYETYVEPTPTPTATPTATATPTEFTSTETWNIIILLVMLIVGLILALKRTLPILNFVFGMFAIAISAWTLTVAPYFGGLLQLAVIIIGIIVMVSGYKEVY